MTQISNKYIKVSEIYLIPISCYRPLWSFCVVLPLYATMQKLTKYVYILQACTKQVRNLSIEQHGQVNKNSVRIYNPSIEHKINMKQNISIPFLFLHSYLLAYMHTGPGSVRPVFLQTDTDTSDHHWNGPDSKILCPIWEASSGHHTAFLWIHHLLGLCIMARFLGVLFRYEIIMLANTVCKVDTVSISLWLKRFVRTFTNSGLHGLQVQVWSSRCGST